MQNPFVYGEVVSAVHVRESRGRAGPPRRRPHGRPEDFPDLSETLRQVVADPARADIAGTKRHADRRGHRQQLQLVRGVPRGLRAGADGGRNEVGSRPHLAARRRSVGARGGPIRAGSDADDAWQRIAQCFVSDGPIRSRRVEAGAGSLCAAGPPGCRPQAAGCRGPR